MSVFRSIGFYDDCFLSSSILLLVITLNRILYCVAVQFWLEKKMLLSTYYFVHVLIVITSIKGSARKLQVMDVYQQDPLENSRKIFIKTFDSLKNNIFRLKLLWFHPGELETSNRILLKSINVEKIKKI